MGYGKRAAVDYDAGINAFLPNRLRSVQKILRLICIYHTTETINQDRWGIIQQVGSTKYADVADCAMAQVDTGVNGSSQGVS